MDINTNDPLKALKSQITEFIDLKAEFIRLTVIEYIAKTASFIFTTLWQFFLFFMFVLFLAISAAFFIGSWLHSYGFGFLISSGIFLLWLVCFIAFGKKRVSNYLARKIIEFTK